MALVDRHVEHSGAVIGAPERVNVLMLNLALDDEKPSTASVHATQHEKPSGSSEPGQAGAATNVSAGGIHDGPTTPIPSVGEEVLAIKSRVAGIAGLIDRLGKQIDGIYLKGTSVSQTRTSIKAVEERLVTLSESIRQVPLLAERVGSLEGGVKAASESVQRLQADVREASDALKSLPKPARPEAPGADQVMKDGATGAIMPKAGLDLSPGVEAFKRGDYVSALKTFRASTREHPDDARVWYFTALAHGLATGQWTGETEDLVNKGVEREKAGTPSPAEIDSEFSVLTKANGRDWLSFFRKRATR